MHHKDNAEELLESRSIDKSQIIIDGVNRFRGFEKVSYAGDNVVLPYCTTEDSAGYDFVLDHEVTIKPQELVQIWTGVKAYMQKGEVLQLYPRSSYATKYHIMLVNTVGIIDQGYYNNPANEGNIGVGIWNMGANTVTLPTGRFCQGIFYTFLKADNGNAKAKRVGGYGSTGDK